MSSKDAVLSSVQNPVCPYSLYSLQFFLLFPLAKLGELVKIPFILAYILALLIPSLVLNCFAKLLIKHDIIVLVRHQPTVDHPHSRSTTLGVILRSALLGIVQTIGFKLISDNQIQQHFVPLGFYLILLSFFHFTEYFVTSLTNPSTLRLNSFLIDNSLAYAIAISGSFVEYLLEAYFFGTFKKFNVISMIGLSIAIFGESIRKLAMFTAGRNFSHVISSTKSPDHKLITHGIYSKFRHPSYAGWFYWAVGSQILLMNPICTILFAITSYNFFRERIEYEEEKLVAFFKDDYEAYRKRVGLWMLS